MDGKNQKRISKYLSLLLRHKPELAGITLDENGWTDTAELLEKINKRGTILTFTELKLVVEQNEKRRFAFNEDFSRIRAQQGHSIKIDLNLIEQDPPEFLYHGTAGKNLTSMKEKGLSKRNRHHVHLSLDPVTALKIGSRHGKPVVLTINAQLMKKGNFKFYKSENDIWLTDFVPPDFIKFPVINQ